MKYRSRKFAKTAISLISLLLTIGTLVPAIARAGVVDVILASLRGNTVHAATVTGSGNVQTMPVLEPANNLVPSASEDVSTTIVGSSALMPDEGPSGSSADIAKPKNGTIVIYVVKEGDSLASIAKLFDVSPNTILWANDLSRGTPLKTGQRLTILPVTGIPYTTKKEESLASIAKRYGGDAAEIASYNGIDGDTVAAGTSIIIPNGEVSVASTATKPTTTGTRSGSSSGLATVTGTKQFGPEPAHNVGPSGSSEERSYYISPLASYIRTQGIHGYNAVDLAAPVGTTIRAAAGGDVIIAKQGGWNGGYGNYVVIQHDNGAQTLYGHMTKVSVGAGDHVDRGDTIGTVGSTGESTGPHVHFEIRNGIKNPF